MAIDAAGTPSSEECINLNAPAGTPRISRAMSQACAAGFTTIASSYPPNMKTLPSLRPTLAILASGIAALLSQHPARAASDTWNQLTAGTYSWNVGANWLSGTQFPNGVADVATLGVNFGGAVTVNLNQAITVGSLVLGDTTTAFSAVTLNAGTGGSLTFDATDSGPATLIRAATVNPNVTDIINASVSLADSLNVRLPWLANGNGIRITGTVSGGGGINMIAPGLPTVVAGDTQFLDLTNLGNSYTGDTVVSNGGLIYRGDVLVSTNGALGNSANAVQLTSASSLTSSAALNFQNTIAAELRLQAANDTTNYTFARNLDFSTGVGDNTAGRARFSMAGDGTGGLNNNTLTVSGNVTMGSNGRRMEFFAARQGQTMYLTGQINSGSGTQGTIYWGPGAPGAVNVDGRTNGTYRFSDVARTYTNVQNLTNGTFVIEGSVGAVGVASPIGTQTVSFADGNGGNMFNTNVEGATRSLFLANPGTSFDRALTPAGGTNSNIATATINTVTPATYQPLYGNSGTVNTLNGYQIGGRNTSGTVTYSANIAPGTVVVPVSGTAAGAGGTNVIGAVHNIALISATGGTVEFAGSISGSTVQTLGTATPSAALAGSRTRITINQFRNHPNLDNNLDGFADANANQLVGTATGGTVAMRGANSYSESTEILGGLLRLDYSINDSTKLSDTAPLILGGGNLELTDGTHNEIVAATTVNRASTITQSGGTAVLQMGAITANPGGSVNFSANGIASTDTLNDATGILGSWATVSGSDWAVNSTNAANGLITAYAGYTDVTRLGVSAIANVAANNVRIINGGTVGNVTLGATNTQINTLKMEASAGGATIDPAAGGSLSLGSGGLLIQSGAGALTIGAAVSDGTLTAGPVPNADANLIITQNSANALTIQSDIIDNGSGIVSLSQAGAGTTILTGVNSYTGATVINSGTLQLGDGGVTGTLHAFGTITNNGTVIFNHSNDISQGTEFGGAIGGSGSVTHAGTGTVVFTKANTYAGVTTIASGTLQLGDGVVFNDGSITGSGIVNNGALNYNIAANQTYAGIISGTGTLTKAGTGNLTLNRANTFDGVTTVTAGILTVANNTALGSAFSHTEVNSDGSTSTGGQVLLSGGITIAENLTVVGTGDAAPFLKAIASQTGSNTVSGAIILTGAPGFRIGSFNGVLNLGLIQRIGGTGGITFDPSVGATVNVNAAIVNNGGGITAHAGGTVVFNVSNNDIGDVITQNGTTVKITANNALAINRDLQIGQAVVNGAGGVNNDVGTFILSGVNQTVNALIGAPNTGGNATPNTSRRITTDTAGASKLTVGNGNGSGDFDGLIENGAGTLAIEKVGTGIQTLSGPQNYSALTATGGKTNIDGSFTNGTAAVIANATLNFGASQTIGSLAIADGVVVTLELPPHAAPPAPAFAEANFGAAAADFVAGAAAVPEPGALGLLALGALGLLGRRRRA